MILYFHILSKHTLHFNLSISLIYHLSKNLLHELINYLFPFHQILYLLTFSFLSQADGSIHLLDLLPLLEIYHSPCVLIFNNRLTPYIYQLSFHFQKCLNTYFHFHNNYNHFFSILFQKNQ